MAMPRAARASVFAALVVGGVVVGGCPLERKMSLEVIDAPLRARGIELNGVAGPGESMQLGPYAVTQVQRERSGRGEALLAAALPRPASFHQLRFELQAPNDRRWRAHCEAQRRQARNPDLAGELDESHDEVGLVCRFAGPDQDHWTLRVSGNIGRGLSGELRAASVPGPAGGEPVPGALAFEAEVIVRRSFVRVVDRELPIPVAQLRRKKMAAAAMLLEAPERAWLAPGLGGPDRELAVVAMAALRLLPIGTSEL
jgi:hypothetical protein